MGLIVLLLVLSMDSFQELLNVIGPLFQEVFMLSENSLTQHLMLSENSFERVIEELSVNLFQRVFNVFRDPQLRSSYYHRMNFPIKDFFSKCDQIPC